MQAESTAVAQFVDFHPTQEAASDILIALADPGQTVTEIARRFHTTLDALAEWFDSPPVQKRIQAMKRFAAAREELIFTVNKRLALETLVSILEAHQHDEQHIPVDPQNLKSVTQRDRRRAAARLAASQLIRLANRSESHPPHRSQGIEPRERSESLRSTLPRVPLVASGDIVPPVATNGRPVGASDKDHTPVNWEPVASRPTLTNSPCAPSSMPADPLRDLCASVRDGPTSHAPAIPPAASRPTPPDRRCP